MSRLKKERFKNSRGFTLIEVIVSLVVAGILGAMLVTFMSSGVMQSANPVIIAQNGTYLNAIMDKMTADYRYNMSHALVTGASRTTVFNNFIANLDQPNIILMAHIPIPLTNKEFRLPRSAAGNKRQLEQSHESHYYISRFVGNHTF
jgi:prepilin-type N-terminal cleavage/methylation domain-containing protein